MLQNVFFLIITLNPDTSLQHYFWMYKLQNSNWGKASSCLPIDSSFKEGLSSRPFVGGVSSFYELFSSAFCYGGTPTWDIAEQSMMKHLYVL